MYEKLKLKSRDGLERLFTKFADCEEVQDAQDAIEETEGNWRNFLTNLDHEVDSSSLSDESDVKRSDSEFIPDKPSQLYFKPAAYPLIDTHTNREVSLGEYLVGKTCVLVTFQPAYWPDTCVRWRYAEVSKVMADWTQFSAGNVIVTIWLQSEEVRSWSKQVSRLTKWPVLWDRFGTFCAFLGFHGGVKRVWTAETLDFLGSQRAAHNWPVPRPPPDLNWLQWRHIGGEVVICLPVLWNPKLVAQTTSEVSDSRTVLLPTGTKRAHLDLPTEKAETVEESSMKKLDGDEQREASRDRQAMQSGELKVCSIHRSTHLADLTPSGSVYQAMLTCYARLHQTTEASVMDRIRQNRRFTTAPESARLQYEANSGLYYDPETVLYYDAARGYFYDAAERMYYYWSQSEHRYIPANTLIQAELAAAHVAQAAAVQAAMTRAAKEREAARQAAIRVAAQLAEIRANKDDYAAYAYATCVIPQQEIGSDAYQNTTAAASTIEQSLKLWETRGRSDALVTQGTNDLIMIDPLVLSAQHHLQVY
ncbi:RNA-binding protein 5-A [Fasciola gigantica]|uniref:RNA-binding protein 5-A n=1 Tax=Fasciola gigantica TaxID=46835 RepID=A0A504YW30_FASGI|nr:RNA-binding protein 5-A [Fasciola gigantica]